jgi:hypothetical protein
MLLSRLATAALLVALAAAACGGNPVPSTGAEAPADGPQVASDVDGRYRLDFALPKRTYTAREPIEGVATLSVLGPGAGRIGASGGGPIGFAIAEVGGRREMGFASTADCQPFEIGDGSPITSEIVKSGGWSADDPDAAFYEAFFRDPDVRLPLGTWDVAALASFGEGDCSPNPRDLSARIRIEVVPSP